MLTMLTEAATAVGVLDPPTVAVSSAAAAHHVDHGLTVIRAAGPTHAPLPVAWEKALREYIQWLQAADRSPGTIRLWTHYLRMLARTVPNPWSVTVQILVAFLATKTWSAETRKSARAAVRSFYSWATLVGYIDEDPSTRLPAVKIPRGQPRPAPEAVVRRARLAAATDRDRLMVMLAAYAGLRAAEIAAVHRDDIEDGVLRVTGKGRRTRLIPLHPDLEVELACELRRRDFGGHGTGWRYMPDEEWLFPGQRPGTHMTAGNVTKILSRILGPGYTGHTLRHRFASRAYAGTHDLRAVQELLGHTKPETTARYTLVPDDAKRAAVESIDGPGRRGWPHRASIVAAAALSGTVIWPQVQHWLELTTTGLSA